MILNKSHFEEYIYILFLRYYKFQMKGSRVIVRHHRIQSFTFAK